MRHGAAWLLIALLAGACGPTTTSAPQSAAESIVALVGGRVQVAPEATALADGVVVIRNGLITTSAAARTFACRRARPASTARRHGHRGVWNATCTSRNRVERGRDRSGPPTNAELRAM